MTWFLLVVGLLLALPLDLALAGLAPSLWSDPQAEVLALGAVAGVATAAVFAWRVPFALVLDHEIAHLAAAVLCLRRPVGLRVGEQAGRAEYSAGRGAVLILLAPYVWPWAAWVLCGLLPLIRADWQEPVIGAVGAALGFSAVRIGLDLRPRQSDLKQIGLVRALVCVAAWGPLLFAVPAVFGIGGLARLQTWMAGGLSELRALLALVG